MIVVINVMTYGHFEYALFYFIQCHTGILRFYYNVYRLKIPQIIT